MSAGTLPEVGVTWQRLHPLSPVVRFGRVVIGVLVIAVPSIADSQGRHDPRGFPFALVAYAVLLALGGISGVISWLVTRWRIAEGALQIETGLVRRQSLRIPLARIQAVDVIAPLAGRFLGLAEVRVVSAGRGAEHGRLAYLTSMQAPIVRARLLALAHGLEAGTPEPPSLPLLHIQNGLLLPALLMRLQVIMPVLIAIGAIAAIAAAPVVGAGALGSAITVLAISALGVARAFNEDFDFTISEAGDGVRLDRGLLQRRHETIPYGRIQAVRVVEPLFWRLLGWSRLEVDVARQSVSREADRDAQQVARTLIPVASRDQALWLLARVMPDAHPNPPPDAGPPRRARLKAPLSFHFLAAWFGERYVYARTGRVQSSTIIVPLVKVQSVHLKSGPLQRAFRVATVDVDTAGRRWQASARCRDEAEALEMLRRISERARLSRRVPPPQPVRVPAAG
ncbi:MAG TPA: PH domain-containing protein [Candidatus Saccharimonadales bacterium]|nr:PH domain-containing protein [Candidatus Saccharimonadales bacterium]